MNQNQVKHKILVVDDEKDITDLLTAVLSRNGYETYSAQDGREAIEVVERHGPVSLIMTDIRMPRLDGLTLLDEIKKKQHRKPVVVIITGFSDIRLDEAYHRGVQAYVKKPFNIGELVEMVGTLLDESVQFSRDYDRVDVDLEVEVEIPASEQKFQTGTVNIGQGGMFVKTMKSLSPGMIVSFKMILQREPERKVDGQGEIVWVRSVPRGNLPAGVGIRFTNLPPHAVSVLMRYIDENRTVAYIPNR